MRKIVPVLLSFAVIACNAPSLTRQDIVVEEEAVSARFTGWVSAINNKSLDSIDAMYFPSATIKVADADGVYSTGWDEKRQATREFYSSIEWVNFVPQRPNILILSPEIAEVTFRHSTTIDRNNRRSVGAGFGHMVWGKDPDDGSWKIRSELVSRNYVDQ